MFKTTDKIDYYARKRVYNELLSCAYSKIAIYDTIDEIEQGDK